MNKSKKLIDIPQDKLSIVVLDFLFAGATIKIEKQLNNLFTLIYEYENNLNLI